MKKDNNILFESGLFSNKVLCCGQQANSENLCPPPRFFYRYKESSENVQFIIRGVTLTRYILSTYVDSNNA